MEDLKDKRLQIRVTPSELQEFNEVARSFGLPTSRFVLLVLKQAIKEGVVLGKSAASRWQSLVAMVN